MHRVFTLALLLLLCGACIQQTTPTDDYSASFIHYQPPIDLIAFQAFKKANHFGESQNIEVQFDPFFKSKKSYEAYSFTKLLDDYLSNHPIDTLSTMVVFECTDGYQPSVSLVDLLKAESFLAFHDLSVPAAQLWPAGLEEKLGPFYLVWPTAGKQFKNYPWPYALVSMRFENQRDLFAEAYPKVTTAVKGFQLYQQKCMKCHSVNKVGGTMGIEFNHPKNITDYWKEDHIWEFVQNPQSFRYNSKMPPVADLSKEQFDEIITYLKSMKEQQI